MKTVAAVLTVLAMSFVSGSDAAKITVNAAGTAKVVPTALQVWVMLKEKGPDAAAAVEALKSAQAKVATKLAALGVKEDQIKGELPTIVDKAAQNAMRMRQSGGRLKRKPAAEEKPEVEMQQMVRVLVPLSAKDATGLMVEAEGVKAKVVAAKLVDDKPAEAAEGDEEASMNYNHYDNQAMGPLTFIFYAPHSEEAQNQALAEAVKKAGEAASRAAKAMGKPAPELHSMMLQADSVDQSMNQYYRYGGRYGRQVEMPAQEDGLTSQTPQIIVYAQISAEYQFK